MDYDGGDGGDGDAGYDAKYGEPDGSEGYVPPETWETYCGERHTTAQLDLAHVYRGGLPASLLRRLVDAGGADWQCEACVYQWNAEHKREDDLPF